jgi:hypothetical protein
MKETTTNWPVESDFAPTRASMVIKIKGLKPVPGEEDMFELQGVEQRKCDWPAVRTALSLPLGNKGDKILDKLGRVMWEHDIMAVLKERIL